LTFFVPVYQQTKEPIEEWFDYDPDAPCRTCLVQAACVINVFLDLRYNKRSYKIVVKKDCDILYNHLKTSNKYTYYNDPKCDPKYHEFNESVDSRVYCGYVQTTR
jgi:hypothetical protein